MNKVKEVKESSKSFHKFEKEGIIFKILILDKGEELFFQKGEKALICEISARYSLINPKTIKVWDNGCVITPSERETLLLDIQHFYKIAYKDDLEIYIS